MKMPEIGRLPDELAQAADGVIDAALRTAAREVTATHCPLQAALRNAWGHIASDTPEVWGLALLRLEETGNEEMLIVAQLEEPR